MTQPFILRALEPEDWQDFVEIRRQPEVYSGTLGLPFPRAADWKRKLESPPEGLFSLVAVAGGKVIGAAGLHRDAHPARAHVASVGIAVHDAHSGKGAGRALMGGLIDQADNWIGYRRLELTVFTHNARAIALYEGLGFEREGLLKAYAFRNGVFVDALAMARVRL
jgi:putative acetyltransferase